MNYKRVRKLNSYEYKSGPVLYWMNREERVDDNWSLIFAQILASKKKVPLVVLFNLVPNFLSGGLRQFTFKIQGLKDVEKKLKKLNIPFYVVIGSQTENEIVKFIKKYKIGAVVSDFYPLKVCKHWKNKVLKNITIPFYEVDAHNIVPCWEASSKQEFGAYTIRPKIHKLLKEYLTEFPKVKKQTIKWKSKVFIINWEKILKTSKTDKSILSVNWTKGGEKEGIKTLKYFIEYKLAKYNSGRNDPNKNATSYLSPYLHYGQISAQRVALEVIKHGKNKKSFLEELIIRKELADNFCFYNKNHDSFNGFHNWAKETLNRHRKDKREYVYSLKQFEKSQTHDPLWNAAQKEMVKRGKMHGFMRMYWAKKILEWTKSPEEAMKIAIYLNDKYELDGRDPNGYTGIAWAIGGVHDRPWSERKVFGKIRYMNFNGCKKKFDIVKYIQLQT